MRISTASPPNDDKRWRIVNATMRRHGYQAHALIETLHTIQETFGYLDESAMRYAAASLHLPLSRVYGVATFYNHFMLKPKGVHSCVVCVGTACYIKNSNHIVKQVESALDVTTGETTANGKVTLSVAHCVGMCWLAPVLLLDDEAVSDLTPENTAEKVAEWMAHVNETT